MSRVLVLCCILSCFVFASLSENLKDKDVFQARMLDDLPKEKQQMYAQYANDILDWRTPEGKGYLVFGSKIIYGSLGSILKSSDVDPLHLEHVTEGSTDIGIGTASYGLENAIVSGLSLLIPNGTATAIGPYHFDVLANIPKIIASVDSFVRIVGAEKEVCVFGSCSKIPIPPLFGKTVSLSSKVSAHGERVWLLLTFFAQLNNTMLKSINIFDPNFNVNVIKRAVLSLECTLVRLKINDLAFDVHGFTDPIVGEQAKKLILNALQSTLEKLVTSNAQDFIKKDINSRIQQWLRE